MVKNRWASAEWGRMGAGAGWVGRRTDLEHHGGGGGRRGAAGEAV